MKKTLLSIFIPLLLFAQPTFSVFFHENNKPEKYDKFFLISMSHLAARAITFDENQLSTYTLNQLTACQEYIAHRKAFAHNILDECTTFNRQNKDTTIKKHIEQLYLMNEYFTLLQNMIKKASKKKIGNSLQKSKIYIRSFDIIAQYDLPLLYDLQKFINKKLSFSENTLTLWTNINHQDAFLQSKMLTLNKQILYLKNRVLPFIYKTINQKQSVAQSQNLQQKKSLPIKFAQ